MDQTSTTLHGQPGLWLHDAPQKTSLSTKSQWWHWEGQDASSWIPALACSALPGLGWHRYPRRYVSAFATVMLSRALHPIVMQLGLRSCPGRAGGQPSPSHWGPVSGDETESPVSNTRGVTQAATLLLAPERDVRHSGSLGPVLACRCMCTSRDCPQPPPQSAKLESAEGGTEEGEQAWAPLPDTSAVGHPGTPRYKQTQHPHWQQRWTLGSDLWRKPSTNQHPGHRCSWGEGD